MTLAEKFDKAMDKAIELGKIVGATTATAAKAAASVAKEKSEQVIEIGKLKKDVLVEKGKISENYEEIGKMAYIIYTGSKNYSALEPLLKQVADSLAKIEECNKKIEEIKKASHIEEKEDGEVFENDESQAEFSCCADSCADSDEDTCAKS